jgi:hypothetical protein
MDTESNLNASIKPGYFPRNFPMIRQQHNECKKVGLTLGANFYEFNALCKGLNLSPFFAAAWAHEGYGPGQMLSGHQAHLELAALFPDGDPYKALEAFYGSDVPALQNRIRDRAIEVNLFLNQQWATESGVSGGWCGNTWQWDPPNYRFVLAPARGALGACL